MLKTATVPAASTQLWAVGHEKIGNSKTSVFEYYTQRLQSSEMSANNTKKLLGKLLVSGSFT